MIETESLETIIKNKRNNLRTDRLDMSFGELMNLYEEDILFITPEYQRTFRWDKVKQTEFIESILLGIPVPPIFVAENKNAKWELVDGLQRISTILSFFGLLKQQPPKKNNLCLTEGSLVQELKNYTINDLPPLLKFTIKRAVCRVEIIRWDSEVDMRYELFKRLNTGGEPLSEQEVRNCIFRGDGNELNQILIDIGRSEEFKKMIQPTEQQVDRMYCEELVLRFFTLKSGLDFSKLQDHMTTFMKKVTKKEISFDFKHEKQNFLKLIDFLKQYPDEIANIFKSSSDQFAPAYYDMIMLSLDKYYEVYQDKPEIFFKKAYEVKETYTFDKTVNRSQPARTRKIKERIQTAFSLFKI